MMVERPRPVAAGFIPQESVGVPCKSPAAGCYSELMSNRLADETSPYLLQHKDNPVDWFPWGEEALAEARRRDKPILLSIGYSACHWCHVMEHESFENLKIASVMNEHFVSIKVDREERPDLDGIYMQAVQAITGRGGWPMTVFLTPEGLPFYGGTYYPPEDRQGMPGFPRVLAAVAEAYRDKRPDLERAGQQLLGQLAQTTQLQPGDGLLSDVALDRAFEALAADHDPDFGGFGKAPKFPQPMALDFLLRYHHRTKRPAALEMTERTLKAMAHGGMYDQAGGGFHRYSTDAVWLVPHFEKMLYDNAQLARVYLHAYQATGNRFYRRVTEETLDYVLREMTDARGGFYSTQDADSEGEEGRFFLWTPAQIKAVLGKDAPVIGKYFGVSEPGNFEGRNILHVSVATERFVADKKLKPESFEKILATAKTKLYAERETRVHPARDDKVLTAWNGLMLRAFAEAALAFDSARYRQAAVRNADFLLDAMRPAGRLLRTWKNGTAKLNGYLEDYAMLVDGLLATYEATFDARYLTSAVELADEMLDLFWDDAVQGFFDTGRDHETLITRPRDFFDNATPAGNSVAVGVLLRLAAVTGNADYERRATTVLRALLPFLERAAPSFGHLLSALDFYLSQAQELALVWPNDASEVAPLLDVLRGAYLPNLLLVGAKADNDPSPTPLLQDRPAVDGHATAYLCEHFICQTPTTDATELRHQLEEQLTPARASK